MTESPDVPHVFDDTNPAVMGQAALALWTELARTLVDKGVLTSDDVRGIVRTAHDEFAKDPESAQVLALLARLAMNAV